MTFICNNSLPLFRWHFNRTISRKSYFFRHRSKEKFSVCIFYIMLKTLTETDEVSKRRIREGIKRSDVFWRFREVWLEQEKRAKNSVWKISICWIWDWIFPRIIPKTGGKRRVTRIQRIAKDLNEVQVTLIFATWV